MTWNAPPNSGKTPEFTTTENQGSGKETLAGFWRMMGRVCCAVAESRDFQVAFQLQPEGCGYTKKPKPKQLFWWGERACEPKVVASSLWLERIGAPVLSILRSRPTAEDGRSNTAEGGQRRRYINKPERGRPRLGRI
jgi:hypothetical protein